MGTHVCFCPYRCTFCVLGKLCYLPTPGHPFPILQDLIQHSQEAPFTPEHAIWQTARLYPCLSLLGVYHLMGAPCRVQDTVMLPVPDPEPQSRCLETPSITKTPWFFSSLSHSLFTWKSVPHVLGLLCSDSDHSACPSLPGLQAFQEVLVLDAHVDSVHMTGWG